MTSETRDRKTARLEAELARLRSRDLNSAWHIHVEAKEQELALHLAEPPHNPPAQVRHGTMPDMAKQGHGGGH